MKPVRPIGEEPQPITFPSADSRPIELEGAFHLPEKGGQWPAAVVCHPHPLGGGTMRNGLVIAIARALLARGIVVLRFNFRGVERSGGQHDNGRGEQADVAGALDWLLSQPQVDRDRLSVVGYSFGAWVGLTRAQSDPRVAATAAVGLVPWRSDGEQQRIRVRADGSVEAWQFDPGFLLSFKQPKLFVSGEHDAFASPRTLRSLVDRLPPPKQLHILPGTDHFFRGREAEVGNLVASFIANPTDRPPS